MGKRQTKPPMEAVPLEVSLGGASDRPEPIADPYVILNQVDKEIQSGIDELSPIKVLGVIKRHFSNRHISDIAAIRACYQSERRWKELKLQGGEFLDYVADDVGKGAETVRRYSHIGKMMEEVAPQEFRQTLWCRPIRNLVAITQAVEAHGDFSKDEWKQLAMCVNGQEVRMKLEEFLEKERKPTNRLVIKMDREGRLSAHRKGKKEFIGLLKLEPENELVATAVQRVIASAGILED